jgi:tetratricopeptide (TPR) repeat protein
MTKTILAAALTALLAHQPGQEVKVTCTDGRVVQGELLGYERDRHLIRVADGTVEEIEESKVRDISLTPALHEPATEAEARAAFDRGDFETAFQMISRALKDFEEGRGRIQELGGRVSQAYIEWLIEKRDALRFSNGLRQIIPSLSAEARRALLTRLAERALDLQRTSPNDSFTAAFAGTLARLADEGTISPEFRGALADLFVHQAQTENGRDSFAAALTLYQGAVRIDPSRRDDLKGKQIEAALDLGDQLFAAKDGDGASRAAREALALDPSNAAARTLLEDVEFLAIEREVDADYGGIEATATLRAFLARSQRANHRIWAEQALARISAQTDPHLSAMAIQIRKYFPLKVGRYHLYHRADGEIQERIRTDAIIREGSVTRVYNTLKESYRDYSTTKSYLVEIEGDTVALPTGAEREPLLKFPVRAGASWNWQVRHRDFRRTVKSLGETVTAGKKIYTDCLIVDFTSAVDRSGMPVSITSRSSYAPGVGLVKLEFLDPEFRKYDLELVDSGVE